MSRIELQNAKGGAWSALGIANFRLLLASSVLTDACTWTQQIILSWLIFHVTSSGTALGSINFVRGIAAFSIIPLAGILIDRLNRRGLMIWVNVWRLLTNFVLALVLISGHFHIGVLFAFTCLYGFAQATSKALQQVAIFDLVPRRLTPNAVAMVQTGWALMRSFGPAIGGFLLLWIGAGYNFLILAALYAVITVTVINIDFPERCAPAQKTSPLDSIKTAVQFIARTPTTRNFMFIGFCLPLLIIPTFFIMPVVFAKQIFHGGPEVQGLLTAAVGIGGVFGGFTTATLIRVEYRARLLLTALFLLSCSLIGFSFANRLWLGLICMTMAGFFEMLFIATNQTLLQLSIPDEMRGQLTAMVNLNGILSPIGSMIAGVGCDVLASPRTVVLLMSGLAAIIAILVMLFSSGVRNYRISEALSGKGP
ncbi:MAG: MFS transporter [Desulfopila sp.]